MPPLASWYQGRDELAVFLANAPLNGTWHWRHVPARANGQAAVGTYIADAADGTHRAFSLDVLTLRGDRICDITSFITRTTDLPDGATFLHWPYQPDDPARLALCFERFGLPVRLG
jgi:RNA polymerase sigma-70 factor (ECF subfamily)